jgi:hypothetical protein
MNGENCNEEIQIFYFSVNAVKLIKLEMKPGGHWLLGNKKKRT